MQHDNNSELIIINSNNSNDIILKATSIPDIPLNSHILNTSELPINKHLISDILKGYASVPNRTIKIVFKKTIQEGIDNGNYKIITTKNGEILTDVRDTSGKIVGKGRIVESGKLRQIASSIFQVTSIAVAQSHLADIETSLKEINSSLTDIKNFLESTELSKIEGAINYLKEISTHIENLESSDKLSISKKNQIEAINKDFFEWERKLLNDFDNIIKEITVQENEDYFGTGDTYDKLRKVSKDNVEPLIKRHHLLSQLSTLISYITSYVDPLEAEFTHVKLSQGWKNKFLEYQNITKEVSETLLKDSWFNTSDTLRDRRENIQLSASQNMATLQDQQIKYLKREKLIADRVENIFKDDINLAFTFDQNGEVIKSAIIHT